MPLFFALIAFAIFFSGIIFAVGLYFTVRLAWRVFSFPLRRVLAVVRSALARIRLPRFKRLPMGRTPARIPATTATRRAMMH